MLRITLFCFVAAALCVVAALATAQSNNNYATCQGKPNQYPIYSEKPRFVRACPHGKLFEGGNPALNQTFYILHLYGNASQQGTAYGKLLGPMIEENYKNLIDYIENMVINAVGKKFPAWLVDLVVEKGAPALLKLTWDATEKFIPARYVEELDAAAAAAGVDKWIMRGPSVMPEAIEAQCTIIGAAGRATRGGNLLHGRFLDFGNAKIKDIPVVTIYHNEEASMPNDVATFGWATYSAGLLTGCARTRGANPRMMSIGEKVWDAGNMWTAGIVGQPWTMMLKRVAEEAQSISDVVRILSLTNRTCRIWAGIGIPPPGSSSSSSAAGNVSMQDAFRGFSMDKEIFNVYTPKNFSAYDAHPMIPDVFYVNKHMQPSSWPCLANIMKSDLGDWTAEKLATIASAVEQSGDIHAATWDDSEQKAYFSIMKKSFDTGDGPVNSYDRQWSQLDMASLFDEPKP